MDNGSPVTKQEIAELLNAFESRLDRKLTGQDERLREYAHDAETRLLRAFHVFSEITTGRIADLEKFEGTTKMRLSEVESLTRLSALELRVAEIEKKLNL